ncbi:hypothetical protein SAMN04515672_0664 [Natronorubrum texcoconense]|uniref:Uncharacterized protein n=1 Tax=Natronorubrum texcoconense TaxID=1095776 RepID=A0A1G8TYX1_9EURY|nr:hypothetical protein SAMN04515672_0664 [Natronorubrum texcoconense]
MVASLTALAIFARAVNRERSTARARQQRLAAGGKRGGHPSDAHLLFLLLPAFDAGLFGEAL